MTSQAEALRDGLQRIGWPGWMVAVYVEVFNAELLEIFGQVQSTWAVGLHLSVYS